MDPRSPTLYSGSDGTIEDALEEIPLRLPRSAYSDPHILCDAVLRRFSGSSNIATPKKQQQQQQQEQEQQQQQERQQQEEGEKKQDSTRPPQHPKPKPPQPQEQPQTAPPQLLSHVHVSSSTGDTLSTDAAEEAKAEQERREEEKEMAEQAHVLEQHAEHVFAMTSSGRPVFTLHGDEQRQGDIFGVLLLLLQTRRVISRAAGPTAFTTAPDSASALPEDASRMRTSTSSFTSDPAFRAEATATATVTSENKKKDKKGAAQEEEEEELLCIDFNERFTFYFHVEGEMIYVAAIRRPSNTNRNAAAEPNLRTVHHRTLLRLVHAYLYTIIPQLNTTLAGNPQYDPSEHLTPRDVQLLRDFVQQLLSPLDGGALFSCVPWARLQHSWRAWLESLVLASVRTLVRQCPQFLYSYVLYRGRVVAVVGPGGRYPRAHPQRTRCGLPSADVLLLTYLAGRMAQRQRPHCWAPVCLPHFNDSGYVWMHSCSLSALVSAAQEAPLAPSAAGDRGLLLVQLSAGDGDLPLLTQAATDLCHQLACSINWPRVEVGLRWPALPPQPCAALLWHGVTLHSTAQGRKGRAPADGWSGPPLTALPALAADAPAAVQRATAQLLQGLLWRLRGTPAGPDAVRLIIVEEPQLSAVLLRPTTAGLTLLCQQAFPPQRQAYEDLYRIAPAQAPPAHVTYDFQRFLRGCGKVVEEVVCVFETDTDKQTMLAWTAYLLVCIVKSPLDYLVEEVIC